MNIKYTKLLFPIFLVFAITFLGACSNNSSAAVSLQTPRPAKTPASQPKAETPSPTPPVQTPSPAPSTPTPAAPTPTPVKHDTGAADKLYERGYALFMNESKYDESIQYFNQAIEADPFSYKAYNGKGIALCFQGNYKEGMALIDKSLQLKPDFAYANFNKAMGYKLQRDYDNALVWFDKALSYDPKDAWSYYGISTIYADWNDVSKSLEYLKKAIDLEPEAKGVAKEQDHFERMRSNPEFIKLTEH